MNSASKEFRQRLEGALIPAVPVPFDDAGGYRADAERPLIQYHADGPAAGVAVWVHTGRGLHLSVDERSRVFSHWSAGLRADQFIIAGVGCPHLTAGASPDEITDADYIARAATMAAEAKECGADGVLVHAPTRFRGRRNQDELVEEYHDAIASIGVPMILFYLYEAAGGISYGLGLLESLLAIPSVAGIKMATLDSVMTFQDTARLIQAKAPEVALLTGEDRFFGYTIMRGAVGALIGMGAVRPGPQAELIRCWRERRFDRFVELSNAIDDLAETLFIAPMEGYIQRVMLALAMDHVLPPEAVHDPWGPEITFSERKPIAAALEKLRSLSEIEASRAG